MRIEVLMLLNPFVAMPRYVWLAPFALYVVVTLRTRMLPVRLRALLVISVFGGNLLLLAGYTQAVAALDRLESARNGGYGFVDPPAPLYWEWALVGYVVAAAGLYFLLYVLKQQMMRRVTGAVEGISGGSPGA